MDHALVPAGWRPSGCPARRGEGGGALVGRLHRTGAVRRRATVLPAGRQLSDADPAEARVGAVGDYLYEPDGAVIRAGLVQQLAALLPGGRRIAEQLAYLSADAPAPAGRPGRGFRVLEVLPYSVRRLRAELARRQVGIVEIKKRGVDVDPAALRRQLKPAGPHSITVLLARVGEDHLAILAEPVAGGGARPPPPRRAAVTATPCQTFGCRHLTAGTPLPALRCCRRFGCRRLAAGTCPGPSHRDRAAPLAGRRRWPGGAAGRVAPRVSRRRWRCRPAGAPGARRPAAPRPAGPAPARWAG